MLFKCRSTHVLWLIWDVEFNGDTLFFNLTQGKVKPGQTGPDYVEIQNSKFRYKNMPNLCRCFSGFQKCHPFLCATIINVKDCISKMFRHHLYLFFFCYCTGKTKDITLKFCMGVVCMYLDHIYFGFLDNLKIWSL